MANRGTGGYHTSPITREYVKPGAQLRSLWGRTERTVVACTDDEVILRGKGTTVEAISMSSVVSNWGCPNPCIEASPSDEGTDLA